MIVCCGEALIDMIPGPSGEGSFVAAPGGCPFNTAIAAAKLGAESAFLGRLGTDFLGDLLFDELGANGVERRMIARRDQPTTLAFVQRSAAGDARYAFYSTGAADRSLEPADLPESLGPEARFLMAGSIAVLQEPLASTIERLIARERGRLLFSLDPNVRPSFVKDRGAYVERLMRWASMAAIVKASSEDLDWLFPGAVGASRAEAFLAAGAALVVETRGGAGAVAYTGRLRVESEAFEVKVADTIGAGDTFHAALLYQLDRERIVTTQAIAALGEGSLRSMLRFAQAAAAIDCTRRGAKPPTEAEVKGFLALR